MLECGQVLATENLLRQLERQEGLMSHIQKALGEYLEGQRQVKTLLGNRVIRVYLLSCVLPSGGDVALFVIFALDVI